MFNKVIKPAGRFRLDNIEKLRKELYRNHDVVDLFDLKNNENYRRTISSIAKTSLSTPKFSAFLHRLIEYLNVETVLETGTSLGINALYLAGPERVNKVVTIEASPIIASFATEQFSKLLQQKIEIKQGTIQEVFEQILVKLQPELCFMDADHRSDAVDFCIESIMSHCASIKCIVVHDIYWSKDMHQSWNRIVKDERFSLTVDIFQAGLIFPFIQMPKQHFTLHF
ncbi:class I SAM-dependent methyltransferase [Ekhidna sp.]|uniref:O-methyltransferase n=1 Tax=Ekhidna sp. TaxID=2608089 RepID=UPI0032EFA96A